MRKQEIAAIASEVAALLSSHNDEVLTLREVANLLGKSTEAVKKLCQRGRLPHHKHYGTLYFSHLELKNYLLEKADSKTGK